MLKLKETKFYFQFRAALRRLKYVLWILGFFSQPLFADFLKSYTQFSLLSLEAKAGHFQLVRRLLKYYTVFLKKVCKWV